jgi:nitrous oxidase accessory protein
VPIARLLVFLSLQLVVSAAGSAVHPVGSGESVTAVLHSASAGDTIRLAPGEYFENLQIEVPVVLSGGPKSGGTQLFPNLENRNLPTIRGGYETNVIHITAPGTVLEGLHVREAGPHLTKDMACILVEADSVTVRDCLITESLHGIYVKGGSWIHLIDNRIEGRLDLIEADRGNGIHLWNSRHNKVLRNEILHARDGIYFSFSDSTQIEDNHIHHVRYGLHYMYSNHNSFRRNLFDRNVAGAALMYSKDIVFTQNVFASCRGFRAYGILYQSMDEVTAHGNLVFDNSRGIFMNNSGKNFIENNDVVNNDLAVQLNGGCEGNAFIGNNFINNLSELLLDVSDRHTRWADETGGNHWSSYGGYDLDRDGIGDIEFDIQNVFQVMEAKVPAVRFYLFSPAAKILEIAERALPILGSGGAQDPLPLMRPVQNDEVPWEVVGSAGDKTSSAWAGAFLVGSFVPFILLMRLTRRKVRRQSGSALNER